MPVWDLFSYREKMKSGNAQEVFSYDDLPHGLLVQMIHIWKDAIGSWNVGIGGEYTASNRAWNEIYRRVSREYSMALLGLGDNAANKCVEILTNSRAVFEVQIDLIEVSFTVIEDFLSQFPEYKRQDSNIILGADEAIRELNQRFLRAGVGYQFNNGQIYRVDSELVHKETVLPALKFLSEPGFDGPREEFMRAHKHYRNGDNKSAVTQANNAFESTLKAICDKRRWKYDKGARAVDLLKLVSSHGLLPDYLDASFDQLAACLKSGLPKVRGQEGAHGQGSVPRETPAYVASYAIHVTAANIVFLVEAHKAKKR